jgi:hypothetical protein
MRSDTVPDDHEFLDRLTPARAESPRRVTRMQQLALDNTTLDNTISKSTAYDYLPEGIEVLAARAPGLHYALLAAKPAGYSHVSIDGTLIETDRCAT